MSEKTSAAVASKAAAVLQSADLLEGIIDDLLGAARDLKAVRRLVKSIAASALTQASDRKR